MPRVVTYISGTNQNAACWNLNRTAVRTHQATVRPLGDVELYFWDHDNNTGEAQKHMLNFRRECAALGVRYHYRHDFYHATRWMNDFVKQTDSEFVVWATADCIFYPDWLTYLLAAEKANPGIASFHPFTFDPDHQGLAYSGTGIPEGGITRTNTPLCHALMMRREGIYTWDEQFPFYEADMDFHCWLAAHGKESAIVRSSRVDHLSGSVMRDGADPSWKRAIDDPATARRKLEKKWGLKSL